VYIGAKKVQESVADVVYFARVRVEARQDDIPEKPAADRAEESEGVCEGFGVCFDESKSLVQIYSRNRTRSGGNKGDMGGKGFREGWTYCIFKLIIMTMAV
jgi:hypothetical protein